MSPDWEILKDQEIEAEIRDRERQDDLERGISNTLEETAPEDRCAYLRSEIPWRVRGDSEGNTRLDAGRIEKLIETHISSPAERAELFHFAGTELQVASATAPMPDFASKKYFVDGVRLVRRGHDELAQAMKLIESALSPHSRP